jgi:phage FluMu protein Com
MPLETYRCEKCAKKLFEGNLPLLLQKKHTPPGETPRIEHLCPRCKHLNVFTYDPATTVQK